LIVLHFDFASVLTTHTTQTSNIYAPGGIRDRNSTTRAATDLRPRPRGQEVSFRSRDRPAQS
jgi:hypothetical protein